MVIGITLQRNVLNCGIAASVRSLLVCSCSKRFNSLGSLVLSEAVSPLLLPTVFGPTSDSHEGEAAFSFAFHCRHLHYWALPSADIFSSPSRRNGWECLLTSSYAVK